MRAWIVFVSTVVLLMIAGDAYASGAATGLAWESPVERFVNSIKGPIAYGISVLGLVVCGGTLVFGGELSEFVRRFMIVVLAISVLAFVVAFMNTLFAGGASVIPVMA